MCGIAGSLNYFDFDKKRVLDSLYHRGPDEQNIWEDNNIILFHTRLAIQDIIGGRQPMKRGDYVIVYNGEIYNHMELREKYFSNVKFNTNSDTETLILLYEKFGKDMFDKIDGMFAFCIYDKKLNKFFLARDRAGKKPLYYHKMDNIFLFASELTTIKKMKNFYIDEDVILAYLRLGFIYGSYTPYHNVFEVPAGHFAEYDLYGNDLKIEKYYEHNIESANIEKRHKEDYLEELDEILQKSVKIRIESSDLEVGTFLSGGIDSNLVTSIARKINPDLKTFTVRFKGPFDESEMASKAAQFYGTNHYVLGISMNLKDDIEKILSNYGEPFSDSSAIPSYYVSKEAKKYLTVILNGDGADELFGGYRRYVPAANSWINIAKHFSFLTKILPKPQNKMSKYNYIYRLLAMSGKSGLDYYLSATTDKFEDVYKFPNNKILEEANEYISDIFNTQKSLLQAMLYLDFNIILQNDLLVKMDIATMSNSLEGRSPFLSKDMLSFAKKLPDKMKVNGTTTKYILRELSKKYLPTFLINQPKRGFEVPLKYWVENELRDVVFDYLSKGCYSENFMDRKFIDNLLESKINVSPEKRAKMLWSMLCLEIWKKNV